MVLSRSALAALACAALLAACSSDPQPKFEDSPSPSPSASSASPVVESSSPTASTEPSSPEDAVRAWVDARNQALLDGDTQSVDALSASDCRSCEELNKVIRQVYEAGGQFDTSGWTIKTLRQKPQTDPIEVDAAVVFAGGSTVASAGADPVSYGVERHILSFRLTSDAGRYLVQTVLFR